MKWAGGGVERGWVDHSNTTLPSGNHGHLREPLVIVSGVILGRLTMS
jgi:hypothetical protein